MVVRKIGIAWDELSQGQFDRVVEALITRMFQDADVRSPDGRGGDGGIDIEVLRGRHRRIYQLKHFPEGFSGGFSGRRRQITKSMNSIKDTPHEAWILVVPCKITTPERGFLQREADKRGITLGKVMDRPHLDSEIAKYPDLISYANRGDELKQDAKIYQQERAALTGGLGDVDARVRALGDLVDAQDPHWGLDFSREGGMATYTVRPKTPNASELSPIEIDMQLALGEEHQELAKKIERVTRFGLSEPVVLPPEVVRRFKVDGPEWLKRDESGVHLELHPDLTHTSHRVEMRFLSGDGYVRSAYGAESTLAQQGAAGWTLGMQVTPAMKMTFLLPEQMDQQGNIEFTLDLDGARASDVREVADLLLDLHRGGNFELRIEDNRLAAMTLNEVDDVGRQKELESIALLADDLDAVGRHTRQQIPYAENPTVLDRVMLRALRLAIDGYCALAPMPPAHSHQLMGTGADTVRAVIRDPQNVFLSADATIELFGRSLHIEGYTVFHPRLQVEDQADLLRAIDDGSFAGRTVTLRPPTGQWFHMFLQGRPAPDYRLVVTPWGLPGFEELEARASGAIPST